MIVPRDVGLSLLSRLVPGSVLRREQPNLQPNLRNLAGSLKAIGWHAGNAGACDATGAVVAFIDLPAWRAAGRKLEVHS